MAHLHYQLVFSSEEKMKMLRLGLLLFSASEGKAYMMTKSQCLVSSDYNRYLATCQYNDSCF